MSDNFQMVAKYKTSFVLALKNTVQKVLFFVQLFYIAIYCFVLHKQTCHLQIRLEPE